MRELTMVFLKPDAALWSTTREILKRLNEADIEIAEFKHHQVTDSEYDEHYGHLKEYDFYEDMRKYITSEPLLFMIMVGDNAIARVREMIGPTRNAPAGTIRGDFGSNGFKNLIHASDSYESAIKEITRFFY